MRGRDTVWVVVGVGGPDERVLPVQDRLFIGRECAGVADDRRLVLDHPLVSRDHCNVRAGSDGRVVLVDTSTNGTRVNGRRVERGESVDLRDGDRILVGDDELEVRAHRTGELPVGRVDLATLREVSAEHVALVVGDIVDFTTVAERTPSRAVAEALDALFSALRPILRGHGGELGNYVGDAFFAVWELGEHGEGAAQAVSFAIDAEREARNVASALELRGERGSPLCMGWGVTSGEAAASVIAAGRSAIIGDAVNLAFRLAGVAARAGRPPVLVSGDTRLAAPGAATWGESLTLSVKGRHEPVIVHPAGPPRSL